MRLCKKENAKNYVRDYGSLLLLAGNTDGEMRTSQADLKIITVNPGQATSHHFHVQRESIFYLTEGKLQAQSEISNQRFSFNSGDIIIVDPGEDHQFFNQENSPAQLLEIESPPHSGEDKFLFGNPLASMQRVEGRFWEKNDNIHIKICGVKTLDMAWNCEIFGVDAIGFHAVGQNWKRVIPFIEWASFIPESLSVFLLTDIRHPRLVCALLSKLNCDTLQIQGEMPVEDIVNLANLVKAEGYRVVKSIQVPEYKNLADTIQQIRQIASSLDAVLLDSHWRGGTGQTPDWGIVKMIIEKSELPIIIAGGLSEDNVSEVIKNVFPYAIDVESALEQRLSFRGEIVSVKDIQKIQKFVSYVRDLSSPNF